MYLDFNPTTTLADLLANNTCLPDTFAGLSNGVAAAGKVSTAPLGIPQPFFGHDVKWWKVGQKNHIAGPGYSSDDQLHILKQLTSYSLRGYAGGNWLHNGPGGQQDIACLAAKPLFEAAHKQFQLMISSTVPSFQSATGVASKTLAMNKLLDYFRATFFKSPAYNRLNGRPVLFCFGLSNTDFDWTAVRNHAHSFGADEPLFAFRYELGYGPHLCADLYFAWTHCSEEWIAGAKKFGKPLVLSANGGFNNALATWGTKQVIDQAGGMRFQDQLAVMRNHPECPLGLGVTDNDYEEGSALEPGLASGYAPALAYTDPSLSWATLPAAFQVVNLYLSDDGQKLMPLTAGGGSSVDLRQFAISPGVWTFVIEAVGKPMVQNVIGSLPLTLSWK